MNAARALKAVIIGLFLSCGACSSAEHKISAKLDDGEVDVVIKKVERAKPSMLDSVAVYGDVRLMSRVPIKSADLGCLYIAMGNERSSNIYVDSIAHIMTKGYPADSDGLVRAHVYWLFHNRHVGDLDLNAIKLVVDSSRGDCLAF